MGAIEYDPQDGRHYMVAGGARLHVPREADWDLDNALGDGVWTVENGLITFTVGAAPAVTGYLPLLGVPLGAPVKVAMEARVTSDTPDMSVGLYVNGTLDPPEYGDTSMFGITAGHGNPSALNLGANSEETADDTDLTDWTACAGLFTVTGSVGRFGDATVMQAGNQGNNSGLTAPIHGLVVGDYSGTLVEGDIVEVRKVALYLVTV